MGSYPVLRLGLYLAALGIRPSAGTLGGRIPIYRVQRTLIPNLQLSKPTVDISLSSANEFAYLVQIDIGGQSLMVLLDTGSSDLWVVSSDCTVEDCHGVPKYNRTSSLDLTDVPFHLDYLMGSVSGVVGTEMVTLGQYQVSSQIFALANYTDGLGLSGSGNSGILGLAFPAEASISDTIGRTLALNLFSGFDDPTEQYFAFKLGGSSNNSSFTVGEVDPLYANSTGDLAVTPVFRAPGALYDYWKLPLQSFTINGMSFTLSKTSVKGARSPIAVLDTGTTLILGPTRDVARFWESVGGARQTDRGWEVPCNRAVTVGMVLGEGSSEKEYAIDPADISWKEGSVDGGIWCLGGLQGNDGVFSADWLLGDTFLRNVYVTHHAATDSQPPAIGLLGTTHSDSALATFVQERGPDPLPQARVISNPPRSNSLTGADICGIATASGFVGGIAIIVLVFAFREWRRKY
ncbi:aspartic peptidase domain-containing protein [Dichomitus squalens]|nr:aspartic peptidase domain-containing protein [Dichomitus squalens]